VAVAHALSADLLKSGLCRDGTLPEGPDLALTLARAVVRLVAP